ncbi:MAG: hypothetical protein QNK37_32630 [Acidobacteriota bacterium]|nr:hypothetical protein [Acidobacteriota bacterium]
MKKVIRPLMMVLLLGTMFAGPTATAKSHPYKDAETVGYVLIGGAALALTAIIWWAVRKNKKEKVDSRAAAYKKRPKLQLLLDVVDNPASDIAAPRLNLKPTYVVGATVRF